MRVQETAAMSCKSLRLVTRVRTVECRLTRKRAINAIFHLRLAPRRQCIHKNNAPFVIHQWMVVLREQIPGLQ